METRESPVPYRIALDSLFFCQQNDRNTITLERFALIWVDHPSEADNLKQVLCFTFAFRYLTLLALASRLKKSVSYGF